MGPTPHSAHPVLLALGLFPLHSLWGGPLFPEIHSGLPIELPQFYDFFKLSFLPSQSPQLCKSWWCTVQPVGLSWGTLMTWLVRALVYWSGSSLTTWQHLKQLPVDIFSRVLPLLECKGSPTSEYSLSLLVTYFFLPWEGPHFAEVPFSVSQHPCQHLLLSLSFLLAILVHMKEYLIMTLICIF